MTKARVLDQIPPHLRVTKPKEEQKGTEALEVLKPNAVNMTAALLDKMIEDLDKFPLNDWSDINEFLPDFKLDVIFEGLDSKLYNIKDPELLKGYTAFKGTMTDILYLLKIANYKMIVYEADHYLNEQSVYDLMLTRHPDKFKDVLANFSKEQIDTLLAASDVRKIDNVNPWKIDNVNPVVISNRTIDSKEVLRVLGLDKQPLETQAIFKEFLKLYKNSATKDYNRYNCTLSAEVFIDMDKDFTGSDSTKLYRIMKDILYARVSPCVYLKNITTYLETLDIIPLYDILRDEDSFLNIHRETMSLVRRPQVFSSLQKVKTLEDLTLFNHHGAAYDRLHQTYNFDINQNYPVSIGGDRFYRMDNQNPFKVKGNIYKAIMDWTDTVEVHTETVDAIQVVQGSVDGRRESEYGVSVKLNNQNPMVLVGSRKKGTIQDYSFTVFKTKVFDDASQLNGGKIFDAKSGKYLTGFIRPDGKVEASGYV